MRVAVAVAVLPLVVPGVLVLAVLVEMVLATEIVQAQIQAGAGVVRVTPLPGLH